jgi:hypothetical protein
MLPFEHVALAAEVRNLNTADDVLNLRVYGLPESVRGSIQPPLQGMHLNTGRFWLEKIGSRIGSKETVWNLFGREELVTPRQAQHFALELSLLAGSNRFRYDSVFRVDATLREGIKTNCLGFVCSFFEHFNFQHVAHIFPKYASPYDYAPGPRTFPSPGHLAHSLSLSPERRPYRAAKSTEARRFARADATLENICRGRRGILRRVFCRE